MFFIFMIFCIPRICSSYSYLKEGSTCGSQNGGIKEILQFLLLLAEQRAICTTRAGTCLASQVLSFESAQSCLALIEQRARVHFLFFSSQGLAALLRFDGFFYGAVCFVWRTLARSAFHGFFYWIQKVQKTSPGIAAAV